MNLGATELVLILAVALLMFGPSRLPGLGKAIGETIRGFKKGMQEGGADEKPVQEIAHKPEESSVPAKKSAVKDTV